VLFKIKPSVKPFKPVSFSHIESHSTHTADSTQSISGEWESIASAILSSAESVAGQRHQDWFDDNNAAICNLLLKKRSAHEAILKNPSSGPNISAIFLRASKWLLHCKQAGD